MQKGNQRLLHSEVSGILALIPAWQTPMVQSSSNYLFGTEGSSQISPLSSDLLWADWRSAEGNQDGVPSSDHWNHRVQHSAIECWLVQRFLIDSSKGQLLLCSTSSSPSSISQLSLSLSLFLAGRLTRFFIWHCSCSITQNKASSQAERQVGSTKVGGRTEAECHLCHRDLFPALTLYFFPQVSRWIFCSLTYGSNSSWSVIAVFSQVASGVLFKLTCLEKNTCDAQRINKDTWNTEQPSGEVG